MVLTALIVLGAFNGLVLLPALLVLLGPPADFTLNDGVDVTLALAETTAAAKPKHNPKARLPRTPSLTVPKRHRSNASLSTIDEESSASLSHASHAGCSAVPITSASLNSAASVFVEPEVVVETTTYPMVS
jgi:hypothetical protein